MSSEKHAYLILAHGNWKQLKKLLCLLDDERNDIYIHVDKKTALSEKEQSELSNSVTKSRLVWTERIKVNWGGYSLIKAELLLLEAATLTAHAYYHLISGMDLPIKTQNEIHAFFSEHPKMEYVDFQDEVDRQYEVNNRIREYHFLQDCIGRNSGYVIAGFERAEKLSLAIQKKLHINRLYNALPIYKGAQWFSITHDLALHVLSRKKDIKRIFKYGLCADELFLQTIVMDSQYRFNVDRNTRRLTAWEQGNAYTWKIDDLNKIMKSDAFWARKFNEQIDSKVIEAVYNVIK